ncbi:hypothetical protein [Aporhodopirellula aestuarii]|uniref:Uncharacterized protein n=1 Tax=Aporhodopirellula aestuarii TaxID=2950107 RepID=A0ABT0TZ71_9BACT|nr:hypothetical protein [Aporhodopirellula aestuarii]MCM2369852.1 hypothetical protein [Aporhodopirellula aestuarii]
MKDVFVQSQWDELCDHLNQVAGYFGSKANRTSQFSDESKAFRQSDPPVRYQDLLERTREAAALAARWRSEIALHDHDEEMIDEASEESFPASDPPAFSHSHA